MVGEADVLMKDVCKILEEFGYDVQKDDAGRYIEIDGVKIYFVVRRCGGKFAAEFKKYDGILRSERKAYMTPDIKNKIQKILGEFSVIIKQEKEIKKRAEKEQRRKIKDIERKIKKKFKDAEILSYNDYFGYFDVRINNIAVFIGGNSPCRASIFNTKLNKQKVLEKIKNIEFEGSISISGNFVTSIVLRDKNLNSLLDKLFQLFS